MWLADNLRLHGVFKAYKFLFSSHLPVIQSVDLPVILETHTVGSMALAASCCGVDEMRRQKFSPACALAGVIKPAEWTRLSTINRRHGFNGYAQSPAQPDCRT